MKLTQEQIEEIRKRAEAATLGPWNSYTGGANDSRPAVVTMFDYDDGEEYIFADISNTEDAVFIAKAREDIPALLAHIAELERINETFSKQIESVNKDRHLWRELRLEASGRLMEVVPKMTDYEEALQKIVDGEADSLGDAFRIAKEALDNAES